MTDTVLVFAVVLGACLFLAVRWLPASLRLRLGGKPAAGCSSRSACGSKSCGGCH